MIYVRLLQVNMMRWLVFLSLFGLALWSAVAVRAEQPAPSAAPGAAGTAASNASGLTPAEAQRAVDLLQDPRKRAELIDTLQAIAKAAPASAKPAAPPAPAVTLAPNSLGAQLVSQLASWPELLAGETAVTVRAIADFPLLWD